MKPRFNPTISFDGVAIILGIIGLCVWMGRLDERVQSATTTISAHESQIREMNIAVTRLVTSVEDDRIWRREHPARPAVDKIKTP